MRREKEACLFSKRRLRKLFNFLTVQCTHGYRRKRKLIISLALVVLFLCCKFSRGKPDRVTSELGAKPSFTLPVQSREEALNEEAKLSSQTICGTRTLENHVEELSVCGDFELKPDKKIIGLVEVRNVQTSIGSFLSALGQVVDSVIIIDDHSVDASRQEILRHSLKKTNGRPLVEILLNKTGEWVREELFDRELLLKIGRKVGGTHFVLLDYDEYLSENCVKNGFLRERILQLKPGESLYLPWIELWKSHRLQRVLPGDPNMNFLARRQTVIYADDGTSQYTRQSAGGRSIGSHARNSTLHVLRCPRTICPRPLKYEGRRSVLSYDRRVKQLPQCAIVEMRFLNLNNILLKFAWYEALGRVGGALDGVTSGKMIDLVFSNRKTLRAEPYRLEGVDPSLIGRDALAGARSLGAVEMWRANDLFRWVDSSGKSILDKLRSVALIDVDALQDVLQEDGSGSDEVTYHVPHRKEGTFVVVYEPRGGALLLKLLKQYGFERADLSGVIKQYPRGVTLDAEANVAKQYELWKTEVLLGIRSAFRKSRTGQAMVVLPEKAEGFTLAFLDLLRRDVANMNVIVLSTSSKGSDGNENVFTNTRIWAQQRGSHIQLINFPVENFGSYSAVYWLVRRLCLDMEKSKRSVADERSILDFVETLHTEVRQTESNSSFLSYAPVSKLIFSLNFGRSGSKYLADLISTTRGLVSSQHEPSCPNNECSGGGALRMQDKSLAHSYEERQAVKLPMIRQSIINTFHRSQGKLFASRTTDCGTSDVKRSGDNSLKQNLTDKRTPQCILEVNSRSGCVTHIVQNVVYAETNPNFKSWIYDVSLDFFPRAGYDVRIVVLRKYVAALLKSLYETGYFTVRDGYNWMETSAGVNSKVKVQALQEDARLNAYGKILSYLVNSEAGFRNIIRRYKTEGDTPQFLEMRSERLYSVEGSLEVLEWLGLELTGKTAELAGSVRDKYVEGASEKRKTISLRESEAHVSKFMENMTGDKDFEVLRDLLESLGRIDSYDYPS